MTIKKAIIKFAKAIRKEAKAGFMDSIRLSKWFNHRADFDSVKGIEGFTWVEEWDYAADIDYTTYYINGIDMSTLYRKAIYGC